MIMFKTGARHSTARPTKRWEQASSFGPASRFMEESSGMKRASQSSVDKHMNQPLSPYPTNEDINRLINAAKQLRANFFHALVVTAGQKLFATGSRTFRAAQTWMMRRPQRVSCEPEAVPAGVLADWASDKSRVTALSAAGGRMATLTSEQCKSHAAQCGRLAETAVSREQKT